jgi:integrase
VEISNMDFYAQLSAILSEHAQVRVNGKQYSERSITVAGDTLRAGFRLLHKTGHKLENPRNIADKHIHILCNEWYRLKRKPKTIQTNLSQFRIFCGWIGKKGMVKDIHHYLPEVPRSELRVGTVAQVSKSLSEMGIDVAEIMAKATELDWRFGLMLQAQLAFGLRRMEALQMQPWKNDKGDKFAAHKTKGGRPRDVDIETPDQRFVMDLIKSKVGKTDHLGWSVRTNGKPASLKYSKRRYNHLMERLGITRALAHVTGHGLRAQFAENAALLRGLIPVTLGGTGGQMDREALDLTRVQVSEQLGHSRKGITTAYYGTFGRNTKPDGPEHAKLTIEAGLQTISVAELPAIPQERQSDCVHLCNELMAIGIFDDPRKVQVLWTHYSRRRAVEWLPPVAASNLASLQAAATSIARAAGGPSA